MDKQVIALLITYVATFCITYYAVKIGVYAMRGAIVVMMVLTCLFATKLAQFPFDTVASFSTIWFTAAIVMQILTTREHWTIALSNVRIVFSWIAFLCLTIWALSLSDVIDTLDANISQAITLMAKQVYMTTLWTWSAFVLGSFVLVSIDYKWPWKRHSRFGGLVKMLLITVLVQAVDSIVFYPGAFPSSTHMTELMVNGFIWKCAMTVPFAATLFLYPLSRRPRHMP